MKSILGMLLLCTSFSVYGNECNSCYTKQIRVPQQLNIFGRIGRNTRLVTQKSFDLVRKITPRISFKEDEKQVVDSVRACKETNARLTEVSK